MEIIQIIFIAIALFLVFSMYMTWTVPKTMQAAYWLIMFLVGIAILFLLSNSEVLFAFQISIYGGGISVLLLFAALLAQHDDYTFVGNTVVSKIRGIFPQLLAFALVAFNLILLPFVAITGGEYDTSANELGNTQRTVEQAFIDTAAFTQELWTEYVLVIPFLALLLLTALLGSVKLVIREWELENLSELMDRRYRGNQEGEL